MKHIERFTVRGLALLLAALITLPALALAPLEPMPEHRRTAIEVVRQLETAHYISQRLDDALSEQLLESTFDRLDPNRMLFLQSDVDSFKNKALQLDDELKKGDVSTGFAIFNLFRERYATRLQQLLDGLEDMVESFDFTRDEALLLDRSEGPWPTTRAEADELWRKEVKNRVLSLKLKDKDTKDIVELLEKRYSNTLKRLQQNEPEDVFDFYMNSLSELYDPHTDYFSPRFSENFQINMSLKLEGIGAVLQADDEYVKVVRLVPAGPADKQGILQPADRIVGVAQGEDGEFEDVIGWRLDDVVDKIRGPKGSVVRLEVIPASSASDDERREIIIVRNEVKLEEQSAQSKIIEVTRNGKTRKVGVISVPTFYLDFEALRRREQNFRSTTRDVKRLLDELEQSGVEGIVIDLRNNGGGSLAEANALTGLFIEAGPTVQIRHANKRVNRQGKRRRSSYYDGPLVVLINRLSASASEIFAAAIQDYNRGIVVGSQSFGKGTVQSINALQHGQLKITESKFYRISGESTQHRGVIPDIAFPTVYDTEKVGESALDNALDWDTIPPIVRRKYFDIDSMLEVLLPVHEKRIAENPDFMFLQEQVEQIERLSSIDRVSLNEETRKAERKREKALLLAIENRRRVGRGEQPIDDLDAEQDLAAAAAKEKEKDDAPDPLLVEAGEILVDAVPFFLRRPEQQLVRH